MPSTIVHSYFVKDVLDILPTKIRSILDADRCRMFGQSVDSLMFYNLFSVFPGKKIRKFHDTFHTQKTKDFFINLLNIISSNHIDDIDTYSFLIGFICHYVLDSNAHPYIFYKTGVFHKNERNTYKYNNVHAFMEAFLDMDMISRRENVNPYHFNFDSFCFNCKKFSDDLNFVIDSVFFDTYQISNMHKIYYKSLKQMRTSLLLFRRDPYAIKKNIYKLVDTFTPKRCYRFEAISYHYPLEDKHNFLNSNHSLWRNPVDYNMISHDSFVDIYLKAVKQAKVFICASFDFLDGKEIDLEQVFLNTSYCTGLDCNLDKRMKYFEY